jgi:menaquinone-dependent protoporphyrinogen oxidase
MRRLLFEAKLLLKRRTTMSNSILVAYATKHGSTREVAEAVAATLAEQGTAVEVRPAAEVTDVGPYDAVVLGGSLYMGHWHRDAVRFLRRHDVELAALPVAVFAMGPRTLENNDVEGARMQLDHALAKVRDFEPVEVAIFGGVIRPETLRFPLNRISASDARDWDAIRAWSERVAAVLTQRAVIA